MFLEHAHGWNMSLHPADLRAEMSKSGCQTDSLAPVKWYGYYYRVCVYKRLWSCFQWMSTKCIFECQKNTMVSSNTTVLVTGGSGFLASYCIIILLNAGYKVRTTIRSLSKKISSRTNTQKRQLDGHRLEPSHVGRSWSWQRQRLGHGYSMMYIYTSCSFAHPHCRTQRYKWSNHPCTRGYSPRCRQRWQSEESRINLLLQRHRIRPPGTDPAPSQKIPGPTPKPNSAHIHTQDSSLSGLPGSLCAASHQT